MWVGVPTGGAEPSTVCHMLLRKVLSSEPTSEYEPGHISQVFKEAYMLHDRVIRPAQVVVPKEEEKKEDKEDGGNEDQE